MIRNIREHKFDRSNPRHLYVGRQARYLKPGQPSFGNPYSHQDSTSAIFRCQSRAESIQMYRSYGLTPAQFDYLKALVESGVERANIELFCHCHPLACHAEAIQEWYGDIAKGCTYAVPVRRA